MGIFTRQKRAALLGVVSCAAIFATASFSGVRAQTAAPQSGATAQPAPANAQAPAPKPSDLAKKSFEAGVKSYQSGKHQPAIDQFNTALRGGGLAPAEMAKALYYRGLAYKKLGKPGLAISDLTSALWLKNGLSDADRKIATTERAEAYKAAGLGDGNSGADVVAVAEPAQGDANSTPSAAKPAAAQPPVPAPAPQATSGNGAPAAAPVPQVNTQPNTKVDAGVPQPLTMGAGDVPPPPPPATAAKGAEGGIDQAAAMDQPRYVSETSKPQNQPPVPSAGNTSSSSSESGGFFSNMFSSSKPAAPPAQAPAASQAPSPASAPVTTASTGGPTAATSSWNSKTPGATAKADNKGSVVAANTPAEKASPPPAVPAPPAVKGGKYKAHIGAFRSRAEAEALAQKLVSQHAAAFPNRSPTVDEAVIGSMGTFYRVRIGSYASADEPRGLCNTLRNSGYDCLVVSN